MFKLWIMKENTWRNQMEIILINKINKMFKKNQKKN